MLILVVFVTVALSWLFFNTELRTAWRKQVFPKIVSILKWLLFPAFGLQSRYKEHAAEASLYAPQQLPVLTDVVLSMTTTPTRLKTSLHKTLANVANQVQEVHINIPTLFRGKEPYDAQAISHLKHTYANLQVHIQDADEGPGMKLLPTLRRLLSSSKKCIVLTLDDDVVYPTASIAKQVQMVRQTGAVCTHLKIQIHHKQGTFVQVFGNKGVAYPSTVLQPRIVQDLTTAFALPSCKFHDDMAIGLVLQKHDVPIARFEDTVDVLQLPAGSSQESVSFKTAEHMHDRDTACIDEFLQHVTTL